MRSVQDLEVGEKIVGKSMMPGISDEKVVLTLIEKRPGKGDKFSGTWLGIHIGNFIAEPAGNHVKWRKATKKKAVAS